MVLLRSGVLSWVDVSILRLAMKHTVMMIRAYNISNCFPCCMVTGQDMPCDARADAIWLGHICGVYCGNELRKFSISLFALNDERPTLAIEF